MRTPFAVVFLSALLSAVPAQGQLENISGRWDNEVLVVSLQLEAEGTGPPYHFPGFQLQWGHDLVSWTDTGAPLLPVTQDSPILTIEQRWRDPESPAFVRFLQLPSGSNHGSADLSGSDLSGQDLAYADLRGATLTGTRFNGADLTGARFDAIAKGDYILTSLGGASIPTLPYAVSEPEETLIICLTDSATATEVNRILAEMEASLVGSLLAGTQPVIALRLPGDTDLSEAMEALANDAAVTGMARDIAVAPAILTGTAEGLLVAAADGWEWNTRETNDGNWGMEWARIPQMWNFHDAIERLANERNGSFEMFFSTVVHDEGFVSDDDHFEIEPAEITEALPGRGEVHGTQVVGILAAESERGGIEGVEPFVDLASYATPMTQFAALKAVEWLAENEGPRIICQSFAVPWEGQLPNADPELQDAVAMYGDVLDDLLASLEAREKAPLIVVAAGNDGVDARWAGAAQYASLAKGSEHVIVVGAQQRNTGGPADFSNTNVDLYAPGTDVLTTLPEDGYGLMTGTSAAAPHVAGVASYLLHLNPFLRNLSLKEILMKGNRVGLFIPGVTEPGNLDAFASVMNIDTIAPAAEGTMLRFLLDIDDGSEDGNVRASLTGAVELMSAPEDDRSFDELPEDAVVIPNDDIDEDGARGDGRIDMADFRRWRDWLLLGERHALNGGGEHPKLDANRNGKWFPDENETMLYPRGDFNGDGKMDRDTKVLVNGLLEEEGPLTDLEVMTESGSWVDEEVAVEELPMLIDSIDVWVSAEQLLMEKAPEMRSGQVTLYDEATDAPAAFAAEVTLDTDHIYHLYTVPVGVTYYAASQPIEIVDEEGDTVKVRMESIDCLEATEEWVGGDFFVDLTKVERTTKVALNGDVMVESDPEGEEVEVDLVEDTGPRAWATEEGAFGVAVESFSSLRAPDGNDEVSAFVRWQRSFEKLEDEVPFEFEVHPLELAVTEGICNGLDVMASAEIEVERRYYGNGSEWETVFRTCATIQGRACPSTNHNFRLSKQEGDVPRGEFRVNAFTSEGSTTPSYTGCSYRQDGYEGTIPLDDIEEGHTFEMRYTLRAVGVAAHSDGETASASIGDPLDYGSMRMRYGSFGDAFPVSNIDANGGGGTTVSHASAGNFYFVLLREGVPVAISLGTDGTGTLVDPATPPEMSSQAYEVVSIPVALARDHDGDGLDDVFELEFAAILDPFDPADAARDSDGDGATNLEEYEAGTDPSVFDEEPEDSESDRPTDEGQRFPGLLVDRLRADRLHVDDINGDGVPDFYHLGAARLGNPDGTLQGLTESTLPYPSIGAQALADFDGDGDLDLALASGWADDSIGIMSRVSTGGLILQEPRNVIGENTGSLAAADINGDGKADLAVGALAHPRVRVLLGSEQSLWATADTVVTSGNPRDVALGDVNGDGLTDLVVSLALGALEVYIGEAGNRFADTSVDLTAHRDPIDLKTADINGDGREDILLLFGFTNTLQVILANAAGTFESPTDYDTGVMPSDLEVADLNGDDILDIVISHDVSFFHGVFVADGSGSFAPMQAVPTNKSATCSVIDWDGDGHLDIISPATSYQALVVFGNGDGTFRSRNQLDFVSYLLDATLTNIDADPFLELIVLDRTSINVWELGFDGVTGRALRQSITVAKTPSALRTADFDGDGDLDLAVLSMESRFVSGSRNAISFFENDGTGLFSEAGEAVLTNGFAEFLPAQLDGDGLPDLLGLTEDDPRTVEFEAGLTPLINTGGFTVAESSAWAPGIFVSAPSAQDLDADGIDEIFFRTSANGQLITHGYEWEATGNWSARDLGQLQSLVDEGLWRDTPNGLTFISRRWEAGQTHVAQHTITGGSFAAPVPIQSLDGDHDLRAYADFDGDGADDLLVGDNVLTLHRGDSLESTFTPVGIVTTIVDIDRDGDLDVVSWAPVHEAVTFLMQR